VSCRPRQSARRASGLRVWAPESWLVVKGGGGDFSFQGGGASSKATDEASKVLVAGFPESNVVPSP
jgi:hypothetical protein